MVTTVEQVFHPLLFIVCHIIGLDFYPRKQPRNRWIINLSIIYCLTFWFGYIYILYYITTTFTISGIKSNITRIIMLQPSIFISIMFAFISRYHRKRFAICLKKIAIVDDSFEELGTPKMYHKMRMWSKRIIIGWLIYCISMNFYESLWWLQMKETVSCALYISHIFNYPLHINIFVDLLFISVLWYIGTRFDKINEHMRYLVKKGYRQRWKKQVVTHHQCALYTDNYKQTWILIRHVHLELCRLARELNFIFGVQVTFEMAICFSYLIVMFHFLCHLIMKEYKYENIYENIFNVSLINSIYQYFGISIWLSSWLLKFFTINYMCENVSIKANQIDKIIHELSNTSQYADIRKEIYQFTLQTTYHQLKFTGMGFFYLGNSLLRKACITVLTFVIIMRQMKIYL